MSPSERLRRIRGIATYIAELRGRKEDIRTLRSWTVRRFQVSGDTARDYIKDAEAMGIIKISFGYVHPGNQVVLAEAIE